MGAAAGVEAGVPQRGGRWSARTRGVGVDEQRFDDLTRAIAGGASRRRIVKGLVAGVAGGLVGFGRFGRARGQQSVGLGGPCSAIGANAECSQAGTPAGGVPVICGDNGVGRDGAFNCCRNAGGVCSADFQCCGAAVCASGVCANGGVSGLPLGSSCAASSQCSQAGGPVVCADNGFLRDGTTNCCRNQGGACTGEAGCCGGLPCVNGVCGGTASAGLAVGSVCTASSECSQTGGAVVCAENGVSSDGALNCCRNEGGTCANAAGCCGGLSCTNGVCSGAATGGTVALGGICTAASQCDQTGGAVVCADNGISIDGSLNCCRNAGGACTDANNSAACCGGLYCVNGACGGGAVSGGTLAPGATCTAGNQCSQSGGPVICADNGITTDGALNCCRADGGACTDGAGCCGALRCEGGACTSGGTSSGGTLPLQARCTSAAECSQLGGPVVCADNGIGTDGALNCCRNAGGICTASSNSASCCGGLLCVNGRCQ